ncbi:molybdate ABC transporter substrate-binding protein [Endothiovibrio diazotrophicus]
MRKHLKRIALTLGMGLATATVHAAEVSVAVAANFTDATRDIVPLFEKATGHTAKVSFGSTGKLYAQIEHGAPFEVFLAADSKRPKKAEGEGLAVVGSRFTYARGKLVLWTPEAGRFSDGEAFLKSGDGGRLAIANPKTAPYGLAARQVMEHLGVWDTLKGQVVKGDSIAQTFQFAATNNVAAGFVALSQVTAWKGDAGSRWEIPDGYYPPIAQQAVLLKKGEANPAATAFLEFLKGPEARKVITGYGYGVE